MSVAAIGARRGTSSLAKALRLLTHIGSAEPEALRLTELVSRTEIEPSTAFRMLSCLVEEEFLEKVDGKRYRLGPRVFELGLVAGQHFRHFAAAGPVLRTLADRLEAPVTLEVRSGADTVCVAQGAIEAGAIGTRLPIGMSPGGIALLAAMPPGEAERLLRSNERRYHRRGHGIASELRRQIQSAQLDGYACTTPAPSSTSVGVVVAADFAGSMLALSAGSEQSPPSAGLMALIRGAAADVATAMSSSLSAGGSVRIRSEIFAASA